MLRSFHISFIEPARDRFFVLLTAAKRSIVPTSSMISVASVGPILECWSGASVTNQVANFLQHAQPDEQDIVVLDWESSVNGPDMTLEQARRFAEMTKAELARWPMIYGVD